MSQFTQDLINYARFRDLPGAVYTRSGVAYQQNASGVWVPFDENVPPISDGVGMGVWEARTNSIRNPTFLGGVAGSPGTFPTNFSNVGSDPAAVGLTRTFAFGVENGLPYMEVSISGTPTSGTATGIYFETTSGIPATTGQTWTFSLFARLVGTATGVNNFQQSIVGRTSGGAASESFNANLALTATVTRLPLQATMANATTAFAQPAISILFTAGVPVNVTYRLYALQMKLGADIGDPPILQTTNAAATRGAPSAYLNAPGLLVPPFTVQLWFSMSSIDGTLRRFATLSADADENNQIVIERTGGNQFAVQSVVGGVGQTRACLLGGYTGAQTVKSAVRVRAASYQAAVAGVLRGEVAASMPAMTRITLGSRPSFASQINGDITRFQIINRDLSDAELQALTT